MSIQVEPLGEVTGLVTECFSHLVATPHLVVRVNEALYEVAREKIERLAKPSGFQGRLVILAEPDVATGDCKITPSDIYQLDASHPTFVNPMEPVHEVMNLAEFNQRAVSIHIYSKPFDSCEVYYLDKNKYADVPLFFTSEYGKLNPSEKLV